MILTFSDLQKTIATKVNVVGKVIDPLSRSFFIESKLPTDNTLRPNQMAQVKNKDYEKANAISIPINLLQNDEKGKFIYVAVNEKGDLGRGIIRQLGNQCRDGHRSCDQHNNKPEKRGKGRGR